MSRCFPFPPPGYVRNPAAVPVPLPVVETTDKLQKEREKAERKKEKRNEKKALRQGDAEVSKHTKRSHKKRKHEEVSIAGQESRNASKESVEHLEKSGLSEEHGPPCFIQTVHGSPESSQDSSKRRKVVLPSPSQNNKNGNILRIKIKRDQDSPSVMLDSSRVLQQPPVQQTAPGSSLLSKQNTIQPREVIVKSAAAQQQSMKSDSQAVLKQMDVQPAAKIFPRVNLSTTSNVVQKVEPPTSAKIFPRVNLSTTSNGVQKVEPSTSAKIMQKMDPRLGASSAKVMRSADPLPAKLTQRVVPPPAKVSQRVDLPPHSKVLQRVDPLLSSKVLQRDATPSSVKVLHREIGPTALHQPERQQPPVLQKSKSPVETPVVKQQQASSVHKEEPCSSGRNTGKGTVPEVKESKSDRKKSRKAEKKERKFGDLFVTWNPPSFEMEDTSGVGDQDWLLGGTRKPDACVKSCTASDGSLPVQSMEQQFSWQPRAIHLPDLNIYQLPYVVPF
uniref:Uncharacterized protein n=1 Tax=Avena sativa TaxID=4498 RepID=A0ACD5X4N7_AVESA